VVLSFDFHIYTFSILKRFVHLSIGHSGIFLLGCTGRSKYCHQLFSPKGRAVPTVLLKDGRKFLSYFFVCWHFSVSSWHYSSLVKMNLTVSVNVYFFFYLLKSLSMITPHHSSLFPHLDQFKLLGHSSFVITSHHFSHFFHIWISFWSCWTFHHLSLLSWNITHTETCSTNCSLFMNLL